MFQDVADFHRRILNQEPADSPSLVSPQFLIERFRFMQEELDEFLTDGFNAHIVGAADAIADIIYVALGTAYLMNLPMDSIWKSVHEANMRKVRGATKRGNEFDAAKPPGWVGPETDIAGHIERAIK
jgi:predicted HAD superfamily Cof-like phosphohydrolase